MPFVVIGMSHRSAPVECRERFAFPDAGIVDALRGLRESRLVEEAVILSTCNRVEVYAAGRNPDEMCRGIRALLARRAGMNCTGDELYTLAGPDSIRHLFRVACGLDSMVLGETEILGQLKKAYDLALKEGHTGARLNRIFQRAFNVAKQVRTQTAIQRGNISVASVAVELAGRIFSSLAGREILILGAGDTGEKTARALLSRGALSVVVANRSLDRAEALAGELGGRAVPFDRWVDEFARIDIIISSTSAPGYVLDRVAFEPLMPLRKGRPLLIIDLAVPRDIDPDVNSMDDVYLYNIDHLQAVAEDALVQRQEEIARCEEIILEKLPSVLEAPDSMT
jgi:glutamyl-tRNA reductase